MVKRKAIFFAPLAIAAAALPGMWAVSASAAGTPSSGWVHLYQVDTVIGGEAGTAAQAASDGVTLTGAIADYGHDWEAPSASTRTINVLALQNGDIALDLSNWGVVNQPPPSENPSNCSFTSVLDGWVPIVQNELSTVGPLESPAQSFSPGSYSNLQGQLYVTATFAGVARNPDGTCNFSLIGSTEQGLDFAVGGGLVRGLTG
jgi:hypothetical protein